MHSPNRANGRKVRAEYRALLAGQRNREPPRSNSGGLRGIGRGLKSNAALVTALFTLAGAMITGLLSVAAAIYEQSVATTNEQEGLAAQRDLEEERAREAELQTYLSDVGEMLLSEDRPLPEAEPGGPLSSLARAKTLTILERLDGQRKRIVLQFLQESQLILKEGPVVSLSGANLENADLSGARLSEADLGDAHLRGVRGVTPEKLEDHAYSLSGATMPDGSIHP